MYITGLDKFEEYVCYVLLDFDSQYKGPWIMKYNLLYVKFKQGVLSTKRNMLNKNVIGLSSIW